MRVAIVTESFIPSTNGVTNSVLRVLDHLRLRGHEAIVVCPGPAPRQYNGFPVVTVPSFKYGGLQVGLVSSSISRILDAFDPDVLHASAPFGLGAQAVAEARWRGIPTVAVFQTDVAGFARKHGLAATSPAIWRWLRTVHNLADLTLAPSQPSIAELEQNGIERIRQWARGVDAVLYHPRRRTTPQVAALRTRLLAGADEDAVVVGYVGRLAPEKRVERLAALGGRRDVRVLVVGDGPSRPSLERSLGSSAHFTGKLSGDALGDAYAALDVFVHTGIHETFGQTLQEAMASGVPVVAPASGGPLDIVAVGETGFLYGAEDDAEMVAHIARLAGDPGLRARMGEAGRRRVLPRSWEALGDQLLDHYADAIDGVMAAPRASRLAGLFR
ncbi:glycosyltransferase family 4 protein [Georgenia sp. Z1344]|uniref:glycosyltransferase family 4 protein n=1 Tax=Georgenia sp. Z1344 TaxID=3416706 RepID=UPI003CEDE47F